MHQYHYSSYIIFFLTSYMLLLGFHWKLWVVWVMVYVGGVMVWFCRWCYGLVVPPWQNNRRPARWKANYDLRQWDFVFGTSRATLACLPLYCSAECALPTNASLFVTFTRISDNAPTPHESLRTCFVCATHARSHFCPQHWLLCHLGL